MSFLIQRASGRGYALTQISVDALRIGRGTNQELRSENPAVALQHAIIEGDAAGYLITDKGSITGTYVNGKPVETARLSKGDVIEIGDLRIEVQLADPAKPLFLRVITARTIATAFEEEQEAAAAAPAAPGRRVVRTKKVDFAKAYRLHRPYLTKLTITALLLIVALAVIGELLRPEKQTVFMPGAVSSAHTRARDRDGRPVAGRCEACHTPWKSVTNSKCIGCHPQGIHAQFEKDPPDCYTCHAEHRGQVKLAAIGDQRCISCHADLENHARAPRAQLASMRFAQSRYTFDDIARIDGFGDRHPELAYPRDANTLRFNHKLHLAPRGVFNAQGKREVLECTVCHALGKTDPVSIDFETHCQRCHTLTFDARFPNVQVPHGGDVGTVYGFVMSYSSDPRMAERSPEEVRRIIASGRRIAPDARAAANAEHVVKTKCKQCHDIEQRGARLGAKPPVILTQWLSHAKFTHTRHRTVRCEDCHRGARESVNTADVLMPRRADCTACHAKSATVSQAASTCLTCHEYHLRPQRPIQEAGGE